MNATNVPCDYARYIIVGAGIHGLSTAWHLARRLGDDADVLVLDKTEVGAGASGIACGVVRDNYFQPAMRRLSVSYFGLCCGAAPHHVRAMAEALGRTPPASAYSADMSKHAFLGTDKKLADQEADIAQRL